MSETTSSETERRSEGSGSALGTTYRKWPQCDATSEAWAPQPSPFVFIYMPTLPSADSQE